MPPISPDGPPAESASSRRSNGLRSILKLGFFFASFVALIIFVRAFDLQSVFNPAWADSHLDFSAGATAWRSALLYIILVAALSPVGIPRQALSALGGYAFGAAFGALFASIGLVFGCAAGFFYSRFMAAASLRPRFGPRAQKLEAFLARAPFSMTLAVRFFPMGNNALFTLAAGLTRIPAPAFLAGSAIGYLPQTIIFALLGSGIRIDPFWRTSISAVLFVCSTCMGFWLYKKYRGELSGINSRDDVDTTPAATASETSPASPHPK